jgi:hypothetical protein
MTRGRPPPSGGRAAPAAPPAARAAPAAPPVESRRLVLRNLPPAVSRPAIDAFVSKHAPLTLAPFVTLASIEPGKVKCVPQFCYKSRGRMATGPCDALATPCCSTE